MDREGLGRRLAEAVARDTGITGDWLLDAIASLPREQFLFPPPWLIAKGATDGSRRPIYTETDDVSEIYANVSVALDPTRQLFNGAPGTVAVWLDALHPTLGERAFHAACGTGYFSAILARLVGPTGTVVAADVDAALIDKARESLAEYPNVSIIRGDATALPRSMYDVGLANMGLSTIPEPWLTHLSPNGGRLVVPLTVPMHEIATDGSLSKGVVLLLKRSGDDYAARMIGVAIIFSAIGPANGSAHERLMRALYGGDPHEIKSLRRDTHEVGSTCWLHEERYCLSRTQQNR